MTVLPFLVTCVLSALATYLLARFAVVPLLGKRGVLDRPGERSSHDAPVVRGGGIAVLIGSSIASVGGILMLMASMTTGETLFPLSAALPLAAAFAFGLVGFVDDLNSLSAIGRLVVQGLLAVVVALVVCFIGGLPASFGVVVALSLILVVNGTNFMDGLNTLVTGWGAAVGVWFGAAALSIGAHTTGIVVLAFAFALGGFLPLNSTPALSFLGDVGSYAVGAFYAVAGWLLWNEGVPAVLVVAPFVVPMFDVLVTLCRRMLQGENLFTAHRKHIYQRLTTAGLSHEQVSAVHLIATAVCGVAAVPALAGPTWWATIVALLVWALVIAAYASSPRVVSRRARRVEAA